VQRREFLKSTGYALAGIGAFGLISPVAGAVSDHMQRGKLKNWAWITSDVKRSDDDWKRLFALLRDSGVKAILPEIYNGRYAFFASHRLPVKEDVLGKIIPLAKAAELEVHAWMWSLPCMIESILANHHDWYNVNVLGESAADKPAYVKYYKFLDPGRPEVREWVQGTVKELADIAELTGIHLDYIRHPDRILPSGLWKKYGIVQDKVYPQYDYGYTPYERGQFKKKFGADPLGVTNPILQKKWFQFRLDMVTGLVNDYLVPAAHAKGKMITAAVFPGPSPARENVLQDWGQWHLDAFLPMLYNVFYQEGPEWVRKKTREAISAVQKPVYSGLFLPQMSPSAFQETVEMALEGRASGVSLFSASDLDPALGKILEKVTGS
jgi:uncharacterized lipoprotein YddW (UPF0748 family)